MVEWWTEQTGILVGALGGSGVGVLGGFYGSAAGLLAPRGRAKAMVLGFHLFLLGCGVVAGIAGIVALVCEQPRHVTFPLLLGGWLTSIVMGVLYPVILMRYREAEQRRLNAKLMRDS